MLYHDSIELAAKLESLAKDLVLIASQEPLDFIDRTPVVSGWQLAPHAALHLRGHVLGHPSLSDGPFESSQLYYINPELRIARTLSRWFRLGEELVGGRCLP